MLLTIQIKELGAILQKLIKTWIDPGQQRRWKTFIGVDGDADVLTLSRQGLGSGQQRNETKIVLSQELEKMRK